MGKLVAMKYRTKLFLYLADHTYVVCGTGGKAWKCWGGNSGGKAFKSGTGSTARADAIGQPDQRAGITWYLIDGVCHQAANRILLPARITTEGARGYELSTAIFGTYGRSSFEMFPGVSGDLPACAGGDKNAFAKTQSDATDANDAQRVSSNKAAYRRFLANEHNELDRINFSLKRFQSDVELKFAGSLSQRKFALLTDIKASSALRHYEIGRAFQQKLMDPVDFVRSFNAMADEFQSNTADALNAKEYRKLLGTAPGERIVLADPVAIDLAFGPGTAARVYPDLDLPS